MRGNGDADLRVLFVERRTITASVTVEARNTSNGERRLRVLLVEDNRRLSHSLSASLSSEGYAVDSVYDGRQGQEYAELTPYDAIILDVLLPEQDGVAVCRALRRQRINAPI